MNGVEINTRAYVATRLLLRWDAISFLQVVLSFVFLKKKKKLYENEVRKIRAAISTNFLSSPTAFSSSFFLVSPLRWDYLYAVTLTTKVFGDYNHARLEVSWITSTRGLLLRGYTGASRCNSVLVPPA